jgi:hypothetical protein
VTTQSDEPSEDRRLVSEIKGKHIPYLGYRPDLEAVPEILNSATRPPDPSTFDPLPKNLAGAPIRPDLEELFDSATRPPDPSTSDPLPKNLTGAPMKISRIILIASIAIICVAAYFAGSGAFKPYSTQLFDFFSQRTASLLKETASLPKEKALATAATNSDHDQVSAPNDLSRSPERPVVDAQTQTPAAAAKSTAAPPSGRAVASSADSIWLLT